MKVKRGLGDNKGHMRQGWEWKPRSPLWGEELKRTARPAGAPE